jgi:hypothetical protein
MVDCYYHHHRYYLLLRRLLLYFEVVYYVWIALVLWQSSPYSSPSSRTCTREDPIHSSSVGSQSPPNHRPFGNQSSSSSVIVDRNLLHLLLPPNFLLYYPMVRQGRRQSFLGPCIQMHNMQSSLLFRLCCRGVCDDRGRSPPPLIKKRKSFRLCHSFVLTSLSQDVIRRPIHVYARPGFRYSLSGPCLCPSKQ